ncbi:MAG: tetratricopeptide repeat protein [Proteobacteria bacterium]|nr:tetratricopeptide repeat protein [Pseudomonadota bacterium]
MTFPRLRIVSTLVLLLLVYFFSSPSHAADADIKSKPKQQSALNYFADGVEALDVQNFEEAERSFKKAFQIEPKNLEFQYYLAITYVRLKRDKEALEIFESLIRKDPKNYFKAYYDIAGIYSREGAYQKALDTLNIAEKAEPDNPRVFLEKGYVYKNLKEYDQAINCFNRAKVLDPKESQLAYYMIAAVNLEREEFEKADLMFKKAIEIAPKTPLAQSALQTLPAVEIAAWARKPWYLITSFSWAYDDNVSRDPLTGIIDRLPGTPTGKEDQFQTFFLRGGYKFLNRKDMEVGVGYSLFTVGYKEWTENNVMAHNPHAYFQANYDPVYFRFQYDFSYFYSGGKDQGINPPIYLTFGNNSSPKLRMHSFMPTISILEPYDLRTDMNLGYQIKEYLDGMTADGSRYAFDIAQSYKIPATECYPRVGYRHAYEHSGDNSSIYGYHEFFVGVSSPIYWGITGDVSFSYMRTLYPEFGIDREERFDETYTVSVSLNRYVFQRLLVSFTYLHIKNDSDYMVNGKDDYTFEKNQYLLSITYPF